MAAVTTGQIRAAIESSSSIEEAAHKLKVTYSTLQRWRKLVPSAQLREGPPSPRVKEEAWVAAMLSEGATLEAIGAAAGRSPAWVRARLKGKHPPGCRTPITRRRFALAVALAVAQIRADNQAKGEELDTKAEEDLRAAALRALRAHKGDTIPLRWESPELARGLVMSSFMLEVVDEEWERLHGAEFPGSGRVA